MEYTNKRLIVYFLIVRLILTAIILGMVVWLIFDLKTDEKGISVDYTPSQLFVEQPNIPFTPKVYTSGSLIDCLALKESSNNPEVINWDDGGSPSYGLLQFKRSTWNFYCVEKYNLPDDIMNPDYQRLCAEKMIASGGITHWSTYTLCQ